MTGRRLTGIARGGAAILILIAWPAVARAQEAPVAYRVSVPEPEHHWMEIEATFRDPGPPPLRIRMSRSSPGRYAVHEFVKNVFSIAATDEGGRPLVLTRSGPDEWTVGGRSPVVRIVYRVFGDRADGTYLAIDTTHAHVNMPAAFIWGVGLETRPVAITFVPPPGSRWTAATQLFPTADPLVFTAPNLQYFMDSPVELADVRVTRFTVPQNTGPAARFRLVAHSDVSQADLDEFAGPVARLVREEIAVIGALPPFEPGEYTFLLDFEPWVEEDGMEHRNSTVITSAGGSIGTSEGRSRALEAMAHEFFHLWNVERLRPAGLEPFDFSRENVTCCLWLAEGFTQYYGDLLLTRAGLADDAPVDAAAAVLMSPGRLVRTPVEMSEHAAFIDEAVSTDPDDRSRTFLSYYTGGEALALALDLSLRGMSSGRLSLDAYMRRLWERFGAPADPRPGYVARPYTLADLRRELAGLTGDPAFAGQFFDRYVEGHEVPDFAALLDQAGFEVQKSAPGRGWAGPVLVTDVPVGVIVGADRTGALLALVPFGTPLYEAGVDEGDTIVTIDGRTATAALWAGLRQRPPGTTVRLGVRRRDGALRETTVTLREDPSIRIVPIERLGRVPTPAQAAFRAAWLGSGI